MKLKAYIAELGKIREDDEPLLYAQLEALERQIPLLYIVLLTNVWGIGLHFLSSAPIYLALILPVMLTIMVVIRFLSWTRRSKVRPSIEDVKRKLRALVVLGTMITVVLSCWGWSLDGYADALQRTHLSFFVATVIISSVFALAQFPPAAIWSMWLGGATFNLYCFSTGEPIYYGLGLNFAMVLGIISVLLLTSSRAFVQSVHTREAMAKANSDMSAMNEELTFHRDNLASEVKRRTAELEAQAVRLQEALSQEKELNQLQNQFVSMVSHEFRTPLTVIDATARRVARNGSGMSKEELVDRMSRVRSSVKRLSGLVERTLDASRLANGVIDYNPVAFALPAFIDEILDCHKEAAPQAEFRVTLSELPPTLTGDPQLIDHMLSNVLSNAIKYAPENPVIEVTASSDGECFRFTVRDNGVGIPKHDLDKVMNRFYRAKTSSGIPGTGIGLSFVSELVAMHKGCICIDSEEGKWTEVTISLPLDGVSARNHCGQSCKASDQPAMTA